MAVKHGRNGAIRSSLAALSGRLLSCAKGALVEGVLPAVGSGVEIMVAELGADAVELGGTGLAMKGFSQFPENAARIGLAGPDAIKMSQMPFIRGCARFPPDLGKTGVVISSERGRHCRTLLLRKRAEAWAQQVGC